MKKTFLFFCAAFMALSIGAEGISDMKIYINAGHGGWEEVNDRHIPTMPFPQMKDAHIDTLGFWESSSNLKVAKDLRAYLLAAGVPAANIKMSRETNATGIRDIGTTTWDGTPVTAEMVDSLEGDRPFSVIKEEAHAMAPDLLLSIHSNAATVGAAANYVVAFIEGNSTCKEGANTGRQYAADTLSYDFAEKIVKWQLDPLDCYGEAPNGYIWSYLDQWTLISSKDGATPYRPTVLCEASFHSYLPNTHRFLNRDYQKEEAYRFYMGLCDIFGSVPSTGIICGDIRHRKEKAPMGLAYNGSTPDGFGKIITGKDQYMPIDGALVELIQGGQVIKTYTTDEYKNGLYFFFDIVPGNYMVRVSKADFVTDSAEVTVGSNLNSLISTNNFRLASSIEEPEPGQQYVDGNLGNFNQVIKDSALTVKRALSHGKYLFVLAYDNNKKPYIYRVNKKGVIVQQFPTDSCVVNMAGGWTVGDIALSSDGYLFATNRETGITSSITKYGNKVYTWAPSGKMSMIYENLYTGGSVFTTANWVIGDPGATICFLGDHLNGQLLIGSENINPSSGKRYAIRWVVLQFQYGEVLKRFINVVSGTDPIRTTTIGSTYTFHPYIGSFIMSGSTTNHYQFTTSCDETGGDNKIVTTVSTRTDLAGVLGFNIGTYEDKTSMFVPTATGVDVYDIDAAFTGTDHFTQNFDSTISSGYMTAGAFAGDTLWLIRNGHLQVLPEDTFTPGTGMESVEAAHAEVNKVMKHGIVEIVKDGCSWLVNGLKK